MTKLIFLTIIISLNLVFSQDCNIDSLTFIAVKKFYEDHVTFLKLMQEYAGMEKTNFEFDSTFSRVTEEGEIESPYKKTHFNMFTSHLSEPEYSVITFCNSDTSGIVKISVSIDTMVFQFNKLLLKEDAFNKKQLLEFINFFTINRSPMYRMIRIINSPDDIIFYEEDEIPDSLNSIIHEPKIEINNLRSTISYYTWDAGSTKLFNEILEYKNHQFKISRKLIGRYGVGHIII